MIDFFTASARERGLSPDAGLGCLEADLVVLAGEVEELEQGFGLLGAGQREAAVEDEAGHAIDALAASQRVLRASAPIASALRQAPS